MDAKQRAVFQGIVYYYRANQVICRYQIALHDPVDPALLQQYGEALELPLLAVPTGGAEYQLYMEAALRRAESDLEVRGMEMNVSTAEAARARAHARIRAVKLWRENG